MEVAYDVGIIDIDKVNCRGSTKEDAANYVSEEKS